MGCQCISPPTSVRHVIHTTSGHGFVCQFRRRGVWPVCRRRAPGVAPHIHASAVILTEDFHRYPMSNALVDLAFLPGGGKASGAARLGGTGMLAVVAAAAATPRI